ncbi:hypothetical protein C8Q78DRAFT_42633 [Trametes maxima]|nr:hypothetical protein C8Q78DRAFT_42633 [Trametes maxima]
MLPMSLTGATIALSLYFFGTILRVRAQSTNATCFGTYDWMKNRRGQSPCLVAAYLLTPCSHNSGALNGSHSLYNFAGTSLEDTDCVCNTVFFSVLYACATCQGAELSILPWYIVSENCTSTFMVPISMTDGTSVPYWAYIDYLGNGVGVMSTGRLDISHAKEMALADQPDSTSPGPYGGVPTETNFNPYGNQISFYDVGRSPSTGVIVGAAIGSVVGALVILAAALVLRRRHRRKRLLVCVPAVPPKEGGISIKDDTEYPTKLYNPDDPSTHPLALSPGMSRGKNTPQFDRVARSAQTIGIGQL